MKSRTYNDIQNELCKARQKFPTPKRTLAALSEEAGEVAKALLQQTEEKEKGVTDRDVYAEAIQTAVMAIRLAEEGDITFEYNPENI